MNVMLLLADFAQRDSIGKLNAIGMGWAHTTTPLGQHALVLLIDVDEDELGIEHELKVKLVDDAGDPVVDQSGPVEAEIGMTPNRSGDVAATSVTSIPINLAAGLPLKEGAYTWEVTCSTNPDKHWKRAFEVRGKSPSATRVT